MFENLKKITITGGFFDKPTTLELFRNNQYLSIVYGRNGSGKTTVAKAVRQLAGKDSEQSTEEGHVTYTVSTDATISNDQKESIFIFDEEFVRENVRMKGKGLETIVMLGEQVDVDKQIAEKTEEKSKIEKDIVDQSAKLKNFENKGNTSSPQFFFDKIRDGLREDGGWADVDRDVKGNTVKSRVSDDLVRKLAFLDEPKETEDTLRTQLKSDLTLYTKTADAREIAWEPVELMLPENLDEVKSLLEKSVESPILSNREQKLLTFLQEHAEFHSQETTRRLVDEQWPFCPLCLRETGNETFEHISETLKRILNRESEKYREDLNAAMQALPNVEMSLPVFPNKLNEAERTKVQLAIERLNKVMSTVRKKIDQRKNDIYGDFKDAINAEAAAAYSTCRADYISAVNTLERCVATFNRSVNERMKLKDRILQENDRLARKHLSALLGGYIRANKSYEDCKKSLSKLERNKELVESEIKALKARIERIDIAQKYINEELQYVFFSDKKVKLVPGDGYYKLMVNGSSVPPKKISVGERNVLGLCYFFARLFSDKRNEDKYKSEIFVVIDDPVSSFDYGNRLGVMSLLRYQFDSIKNGNPNSRILLMTHDLRSAFDMVKIRSDLNGGKSTGKKFFELVDKQLKEREVSNEYKKMLEYVYNYAKSSTEDIDEYEESSIGNVMRRVLEAFSSFCYNMSFEQMMCRKEILDEIPDEKRKYYENFMCRLALNGESHMEEHVYDLNTITPYFTQQEKIRTAKSLLLFLNYVNKEHLSCYLPKENGEDRIAVIKGWEAEDAGWMA